MERNPCTTKNGTAEATLTVLRGLSGNFAGLTGYLQQHAITTDGSLDICIAGGKGRLRQLDIV